MATSSRNPEQKTPPAGQPPLFTRNFTLLLLGQLFSLFGNIILRFALAMFVLEATGSAVVYGGMLAVATLPTILLAPLGGVLADRANRRNVMVALDALTGAVVLAAAGLLRLGGGVPVVAGLLVVLSVLGAFETPTVQACVPQMQTGANITRGNAVINQIASLSSLLAPLLGGVLYTALGLGPVLAASVACFFATALLECFIRLPRLAAPPAAGGVLATIGQDIATSLHFLRRQQPAILRVLLLAAAARFFVMGTMAVGLPFLVRTQLGLSATHYGVAESALAVATHYGVAESALAVATIGGSLAAGLLAGRWPPHRWPRLLVAMGLCMAPAGLAFLLPLGTGVRYAVLLVAFCGVQVAVSLFSLFAVSFIQQHTPPQLLGKVMAYTAAITLCAQPLGQAVYGLLFQAVAAGLVLLPTAAALAALAPVAQKALPPTAPGTGGPARRPSKHALTPCRRTPLQKARFALLIWRHIRPKTPPAEMAVVFRLKNLLIHWRQHLARLAGPRGGQCAVHRGGHPVYRVVTAIKGL